MRCKGFSNGEYACISHALGWANERIENDIKKEKEGENRLKILNSWVDSNIIIKNLKYEFREAQDCQ